MRSWIDPEQLIAAAGFTEYDHDSGTSGFCGMFALALYRALIDQNPELVLIGAVNAKGKIIRDRTGGIYWHHAAVLLNGSYYDIEGKQEPQWMIDNYIWGMPLIEYKGAIIPTTPEQFVREMRTTPGAVDWRFYTRCKKMLGAPKGAPN